MAVRPAALTLFSGSPDETSGLTSEPVSAFQSDEGHAESNSLPNDLEDAVAPDALERISKSLKRQSTPNPRRQSSISYITSTPPPGLASPRTPIHSPRSPSARASVHFGDVGFGNLRSPLSAFSPTATPSSESGTVVPLSRSQSLSGPSWGNGVPTSRGIKSPTRVQRSSTGSVTPGGASDQKMMEAARHLKERPPLTLVEKHADLLQFIAQKESKCLELRSQLAIHEAELQQLKRKWERIVNRGLERSSPTPPSALPSNSPGLSSNAAFSSTISPGSHAPVLEGIKEGVQGVGRFFAAMTGVAPNEPDPTKRPEDGGHSSPSSANSTAPANGMLPLRLSAAATVNSEKDSEKEVVIDGELGRHSVETVGSKLERRTSRHRHGQKESQSSSSTNASASTSISVISAFSTTTVSTATSISSRPNRASIISLKDGSPLGSPLKNDLNIDGGIEAESDFGDFHEGISSSSASISGSEQVLYVRDTGATPMMSPNPEFERKRRKHERKSTKSAQQSGTSTPALDQRGRDNEENLFDAWDDTDAWAEDALREPSPSAPAGRVGTSNKRPIASSQPPSSRPSIKLPHAPVGKTHRSQQPQALPPMGSIPGLATIGMAAPAAQQVSSWVGNVSKKWGDIKGSNTFTKNQKRASLLLSDMQNTFVSSLISPSLPSSSTSPSNAAPKSPHLSPHTPSQVKRSPSACSSTSASLLDDSDEEMKVVGDDTVKVSTPVLVPSPVSPSTNFGKEKEQTTDSKDDEEWNW